MKIVYQGDLHLRDKSPINRIDDDYRATCLDKLQQLVDFANEHEAVLMLGGDIFDSHNVSAELVNRTVGILDGCINEVIATFGQHDVPYHQVVPIKSPVQTLYEAEALYELQAEGFCYIDEMKTYVHFAGWEKTPNKPLKGKFNILLGHISVFEEKLPFYWKGEGYTADSLRERYPGFDLYLCGDIHIPFVKENVVVSGSMMRQNIDQIKLKPRCYLIDTDTMEITPLFYKISNDVFAIPDEELDTSWELEVLVAAMKAAAFGKESYERDCITLAEEDVQVKTIIQEVFDERVN